MQAVGRRYVRYFNDRHGRSGTLWEGRYRSTLIQTDRYLLTCMAYIDLNPVRAGMVADARDFPVVQPRPLRRAAARPAADARIPLLLGRWATRPSRARPRTSNWCAAGVRAADQSSADRSHLARLGCRRRRISRCRLQKSTDRRVGQSQGRPAAFEHLDPELKSCARLRSCLVFCSCF